MDRPYPKGEEPDKWRSLWKKQIDDLLTDKDRVKHGRYAECKALYRLQTQDKRLLPMLANNEIVRGHWIEFCHSRLCLLDHGTGRVIGRQASVPSSSSGSDVDARESGSLGERETGLAEASMVDVTISKAIGSRHFMPALVVDAKCSRVEAI